MTATTVFVTKADLAQLRYLSSDQVKAEILERARTLFNREVGSNMDIKAIKVVVYKRDVSIDRSLLGVDVTIHHPNQSNRRVPYPITGGDADVGVTQIIIERATSQDWSKTHTDSMVRDLCDVLRSVAGV